MARDIDADALIKNLEGYDFHSSNGLDHSRGIQAAIRIIKSFPTADLQKVTHAHWIIIEYEYFTCSACGESYFNGMDSHKMAEDYLKNNGAYKYCPWCGAKMDGKE